MGSFPISLCLCLIGVYATVHCAHTAGSSHRKVRSNDEELRPEEYDSVAYCESYCDMYGYEQPGKWCVSEDSSIDVYCCGSEFNRYCCADATKDIGNDYKPVESCPNSTWFYHQWKVIVGLLSTLLVMLLLAACCYYCCGGNRQGYGRARGRLFSSRARTGPDEENTTTDPTFDPASPYAFQPPEYSLPKDPPKYDEIISGIDNAGFNSQEGGPPSNPVPNNIEPNGGQSEATSTGGRQVEIEVEAPPVYEEIDTSNNDTNVVNSAVASQNSIAAVHSTSMVSTDCNTDMRRNVSVTAHGSSNGNGTMNNLPHVESCLPPPYEEVPTIEHDTSSPNENRNDTDNTDSSISTRSANARDENTIRDDV